MEQGGTDHRRSYMGIARRRRERSWTNGLCVGVLVLPPSFWLKGVQRIDPSLFPQLRV